MPRLLLGPILRHVGETDATVWVETSGPCQVEVLGHKTATFAVRGHHYALVCICGLAPGGHYPYEVQLDGARCWPLESSSAPSVIRTLGHSGPLRVAFGSCRVALPDEAPYSLDRDDDRRGRGPDALNALALGLREKPLATWPDLLLMLGDQVYADQVSPGTSAFMHARRDCTGPHGEVAADFEEYHHLYLDAWSQPTLAWLFSTIPTAMIFDDHDVHDDWNTSLAWQQRMRAEDWWDEHIVSALSSYWVYQHIGNLSPEALAHDEAYARVREQNGDAYLRDIARRADREPERVRWSYRRDLGRTRLVVLDSRANRILDPERRSMLDEATWEWLQESVTGEFDHLLIATSLPFLLAPGLHDLEAWSEAVCAGAWGRLLSRLGERVRERMDLEHWAAFQRSFYRLAKLLEEVATGRHGPAPASIVVLSGDVHHAYLAKVAFDPSVRSTSVLFQAVCSPFRNELARRERAVVRAAFSRMGRIGGRLLARSARRGGRPFSWHLAHDHPWFDNQVASLELQGRTANVVFMKAVTVQGRTTAQLEENLSHRLA